MDKIELIPNQPYVIICEGKDEKKFLINYLKYLKKTNDSFQDCHRIIDFGGIDDVRQGLQNIKSIRHYGKMKSFLIIRDAEKDAIGAIDSVVSVIKKVWGVDLGHDGGIQQDDTGVKIGFFLFPGMGDDGKFRNGTLEDLCVDLLRDFEEPISAKDLLTLTDDYLRNITKCRKKEMVRHHKNRIHVFFSGTDKFVGSKIGEAADMGAFDFSSTKLLRLQKLVLETQD